MALFPRPPRRIAWFLTSHGFGHGVRASALLRALPEDVDVELYTALPEAFFREELHRPIRVTPCELDCGCLQPDSVRVDIAGTLARYAELESQRETLLPQLADRLREAGTDLLIGDIPPLAFPLARQAGLPSLALCNFTWTDIYAPYVESHRGYRPMLERMRADYALADTHLRLFPHLEDVFTPDIRELGVVCRPGSARRADLAARLGLHPGKKWCLIYLGNFGLDGVPWERLAQFSDWEFFGLYPLVGSPPNYHRIEKDSSLSYADMTASADAVLGKLGYGLVAECLAHGTRVLFIGRQDFAEFPLLKNLVETRELGLEIPMEDLKSMQLGAFLDRVTRLTPKTMTATGVDRFLEILGFSTG